MAFNSFGNLLKLTTYGESHGSAIGGVIDGFPAGLEVDFNAIQEELNRRKPGQSKIVSMITVPVRSVPRIKPMIVRSGKTALIKA